MATNYTPNYHLCQWLPGDPVLRSDFNEDNQKIEAALNYVPRFVADSYIGNGLIGADNPRTLAFPFRPIVVIIVADSTDGTVPGSVFINGQTKSDGIGNHDNPSYGLHLHLTWGNDRVTWYSTDNGDYCTQKSLNKAGQIYRYFALGF